MLDKQALVSNYESALKRLQAAKAGKHDGLEKSYGLAYQGLVRNGLAQQIRRKYRGT